MHKTKILIVAPIYEPYSGGGANYFPKLAKSLSISKDVTVLTEAHCECKLKYASENVEIRRFIPRRDSIYPLNIIISAVRLIVTYIVLSVYVIYWTLKHYGKQKIIILTRYYFRPIFYFFYIYKKIFRTRIVIDYRTEVDAHIARRINANFFDVTFCNSLSCYEQTQNFQNMRGRQHVYIPNAIELPDVKFHSCKEPKQPYSIFVGTLSSRKSFDIVVEVQNRLKQDLKLHPVIVGRPVDYDEEYIKIFLNEYSYHERLEHECVICLLANASVVLLPSRKEGLPRVAIETLSMHGRIVLPPCCKEFDGLTLSLNDLDVDTVYRFAKHVMINEITYDCSLHSWDGQFAKYLKILDSEIT